MSENGAYVERMEGWSIVTHRDDVGSDADSVEVISEDSDRDTCDEGKDEKDLAEDDKKMSDEDLAPPVASGSPPVASGGPPAATPDTTNSDVDPDGSSDDSDTDLVDLDPFGDLTRTISDKLSHFLCLSNQNLTRDELLFRNVVLAFILLMLISSLLVSSFLLFFKINHAMMDRGHDPMPNHALQELDGVISKLKKALRLENEQHLREILSKMPVDSITLERLIPMAGHFLGQADNVEVDKTSLNAKRDIKTEKVHELSDLSGDRSDDAAKPKTNIPEQNGKDTTSPNLFDSKTTQQDQLNRETGNNAKTIQHNEVPLKPILPSEGANSESTYNYSASHVQNTLLAVRQDIIAIQENFYSQIMHSLLEYKIDLYRNMLRARLDVSFPGLSSKEANHMNFMLIRIIQQTIARSSESNFESWYKFYSYSVFPKINDIVGKIDSIKKGSKGPDLAQPGKEPIRVDGRDKSFNDDFFVRAGDPHEPVVTVETVARKGFDWRNLDKKIRENMRNALKHVRPKNTHGYSHDGKRRGDEGMQQNFVELDQDFINDLDRQAKNNLKGDFRKRKNDQKKYKHQASSQRDQEHGRDKDHKGKHEKPNYKQERGEEKIEHKHENSKHAEANNKNKHDSGEHKHDKWKKVHDEYKYDHEKQTQDENPTFTYDEYLKNRDKKAEAESSSGRNDRGKHFKKKQDENERKGESRDQHKEKKFRKKISDVGKFLKKSMSGLWKTVKRGYKSVKDYGKDYVKDWRSFKFQKTGKYREWKDEFVKEMKDVIRVLGGNPTLNSFSEVGKTVSKYLGDGWGSIIGSFGDEEMSDMGPEGLRPGPEGMKEETCSADEECDVDEQKEEADEGYESDKSDTAYSDAPNHRGTEPAGKNTHSWYYDGAKHRADARRHARYPGAPDYTWFLGLGRHRAYLRRRGIHLDDDGSWFISSAKHRAKMRQKQIDSPTSPYFYSQASSKR